MIFFGGCGKPWFTKVVSNIASVIDEAIDDIAAMGTPRRSTEATLDALLKWTEEPDSAVWFRGVVGRGNQNKLTQTGRHSLIPKPAKAVSVDVV